MATLTKVKIEERAEALLDEHFGSSPEVPVDVQHLVSELGGRIEVRFDASLEPESLYIDGKGGFTVFVARNTSLARDRFTIAHELGHLLLHHDPASGSASFRRYGRSRSETEANVFAGALLMPAGQFRQAWSDSDGDLASLRSSGWIRRLWISCYGSSGGARARSRGPA